MEPMATLDRTARTSSAVQAAPAREIAGVEVRRRTARPVLLWAATGALFLAFAAYLIIAWLVSGEAKRVPSGVTPVPGWMKVVLEIQQWGLFAAALVLIYFQVFRARRREGRIPVKGLVVISFALLWWSDPLYNYFVPGFNYNAYFINLGTWIGHVPGWQSPHPTSTPQPLIWLPGVYTCMFFLMAVIGSRIMGAVGRRRPEMGRVGLLISAYVPLVVVGTFWEAMFMRMGSHQYGGAIDELTLSHGQYYQFPIYQGISAAALYTSWAALIHFKDDRGRSLVEKGLERVQAGARMQGLIRFFAVSGAVTVIFFGFYHIPMNFFALEQSAWPASIQERSYFTSGLCGAGTTIACPGPIVPVPRGDNSLRVTPDGKLIVPPGTGLPHAVPSRTK
jgi:hypothetical protein